MIPRCQFHCNIIHQRGNDRASRNLQVQGGPVRRCGCVPSRQPRARLLITKSRQLAVLSVKKKESDSNCKSAVVCLNSGALEEGRRRNGPLYRVPVTSCAARLQKLLPLAGQAPLLACLLANSLPA